MKQQNLKASIFALIIGITFNLKAQIPTLHNPSNQFINSKVEENNSLGLLWWKCDSISPNQLFTLYKGYTGLTFNDSMAIIREWDDPQVCLNHILYQHYYKGIPVEGSEFREHFDPNVNKVLLSNGRYVENLQLPNIPLVSDVVALDSALSRINAEIYAWEDDSIEHYLLLDSVPEMTTHYPTGELVYALTGDREIVPANYKLAWKFRITAIEPHSSQYVFIDALNGQFIKKEQLQCNGDINHIYYGNKYIDTRWYGGLRQKHFLEANDNGRSIKTKDDNNLYGSYGLSYLPKDADDNWGNNNWGATSTHHVVQEAWSMFKNTYGRNGVNNANKELRVLGNDAYWSGVRVNAFYQTGNSKYDYMSFGSTSAGNLLATYDIAGHEFTHGVTNHTSRLIYFGQSGALNESFSDIFGLMTERFAKGGTYDWDMGEDANFILRNLQNPSSLFNNGLNLFYPNWYLQSGNWYTGNLDEGGVHHNSSVQNRYFYLLSMGGSQLGRTVGGVGVDIAANVSYYSLTNLTGANETYPLAREHAVAAARILYGRCSYVENQVCRAWSACNIGPYCDPCEIAVPCWIYGCGASQRQLEVEEYLNLKNKITIYPNPTSENLFFNMSEVNFDYSKIQVTITDMLGKIITTKIILKNDIDKGLSITDLPNGVYSISISNNINFKQTLKFIKQ